MVTCTWTIAYRKPKANRFLRVDLALTWTQAAELAGRVGAARPDLQVWYTVSESWDAAHPDCEDAYNILTDTGRRVRIMEGGTLPDGVAAPVSLHKAPRPPKPVSLRKPVTLSKGKYTTAIGRARTLGAADAERACDWLADMATPRATYRQWLTWIQEGSPRQDEIPVPRPAISGEWADDFAKIDEIGSVTGWEVSRLGGEWGTGDDGFAEIVDAYAEGFEESAQVAAEKIIAAHAEAAIV